MGELSTYLVSIAQNETSTNTLGTTDDATYDHESVSLVEFEADKLPEKVSDPANIQKIRTHFNYSLDEKYLNDFLCSYQTPQKHQQLGHLVLFEHHLCFVQDPAQLESNRLLEGYADIGRAGKKWKRHFIIANNDHLSIASHKENVYKVSTVIPWCDVFSVEKTDQTVSLREHSISLTTSKRNYFISLDSEKEVDTWVHLIKTKIAVAQSSSESFTSTQEGNLQVQLTFSLSYLRVNDVEICDSYLYPKSIFIQFDNDQELIFMHMNESELAQKLIINQVNSHRTKAPKKPFRFMNIFTNRHNSVGRFSIDADSLPKNRENNNINDESNTDDNNNTNQMVASPTLPIEPSFFVVSDSDRQLFKSKFKFPHSEQLHAVYHCALFKSFDFNGKLFLSDSYICFWNTNIIDHFSKQSKIIIPFTEIIAIKKYKTMHFITSGLRIVTRDNSFNFIHLKKTSKVITFLNKLWVLAKRRKGEMINFHRENSNEDLPSNINVEQFKSIPSKRITITLVGTRGDVQPFIALALKLQEFGHKVKIATHKLHQPFVESYNIAFAPISGDPRELIKLCVTNDTFSLKFIREANKHFRSFMQDIIYTCWEACKSDTDVLIENPPCFAGIHIAEKLNIPFIVGFTMPWTQTSQFPHPFAMSGRTTSIYNISSYFVLQQSTFLMLRTMINKLRTQVLGLGPISTSDSNAAEVRKTHYMYCWSPSVVPKPHDWGRRIHVVGYWFLDAPKDFKPSPELQAFLAKEPKPIYIGFGSIIVKDPDALTKTIIEGVRLSGQRAILAKGWGGTNVEKYPDFIFPLDAVPHDWLFPQLTAAVHHGGAGTAAAAYRAGIPTMIVPFFGDQFFWAQRTEALGVGPHHIKVAEMTPENFGAALKQMATDQTMRKKAEILGVHIREQNGPDRAVHIIHQAIQEFDRFRSDNSNERSTSHGELKVIVKNDTRFKLFRKQWQLKQGAWVNVPPDYVLPFTSADVTIRMDKLHISSIEGFMEYACDYTPLQQSKKPLQKRRSDSEIKMEKTARPDNPLISPRKEGITQSSRAANQSLVSDAEMKPIQQTATFFFTWNNFGVTKKYSYDSSNALIVDYRKTMDGIEFTVQEPATNITELKTLTMSIMKRELSDADVGGVDDPDSSSSSSEVDLNSNGKKHTAKTSKTVTVTIQNKTDIVFKRDQNVIKHGEWMTFPPDRIPKLDTVTFIAFQGPSHVHKPTGFVAYTVRIDGRKEIMTIFFKVTTQKNRLKSRVECSLVSATVETDEKSNLIITLEPKRLDILANNKNPNNINNEARVEVKDEPTMEQEMKELQEESGKNSTKRE